MKSKGRKVGRKLSKKGLTPLCMKEKGRRIVFEQTKKEVNERRSYIS